MDAATEEDMVHARSYVAGVENFNIVFQREGRVTYNEQIDKMDVKTRRPRARCLYLIRNPFNMLASMWKYWGKERLDYLTAQAYMWVPLAREYLGKTRHLNPDWGERMVDFDRWLIDKKYRKNIADFCELIFSDEGKERVTSIGSSFDGHKFDRRASQMKLSERYKVFENDLSFVRWVRSIPNLINMAGQIYRIPSVFQ